MSLKDLIKVADYYDIKYNLKSLASYTDKNKDVKDAIYIFFSKRLNSPTFKMEDVLDFIAGGYNIYKETLPENEQKNTEQVKENFKNLFKNALSEKDILDDVKKHFGFTDERIKRIIDFSEELLNDPDAVYREDEDASLEDVVPDIAEPITTPGSLQDEIARLRLKIEKNKIKLSNAKVRREKYKNFKEVLLKRKKLLEEEGSYQDFVNKMEKEDRELTLIESVIPLDLKELERKLAELTSDGDDLDVTAFSINHFFLKEAAGKYDHIDFKPPESVAKAAARGLELRKKNKGKGGLSVQQAHKQGIGSGVARAVSLKNRQTLSPATVRRMKAFFDRHAKNKSASGGKPLTQDKGYIAWLIWGGDPGRSWANKIVNQMNAADKKSSRS